MIKVEWTRAALADLIEAQLYISQENTKIAGIVARRVWDASQQLADNPQIGRLGHVEGTREWVVTQTPYLIVYRIGEQRIEIIRLWHSKQNWQAKDIID